MSARPQRRNGGGPYVKALFVLLLGPALACSAETVRVAGSPLIGQVITDAVSPLRSAHGIELEIDTKPGSKGGLEALGQGQADVALSSLPVSSEHRAAAPNVLLTEVLLGAQAVAIGVSADVWNGGVRSLTADQLRAIFEARITNWKDVGGPDQKIAFFTWPQGAGVTELFTQWLYEDSRKAPPTRFPIVATHPAAQTAIEFTLGAIAPISPLYVKGESAFALRIADGKGGSIAVSSATVADGTYPISRRLWLVVNDKPAGGVRVLVDFMLGPDGREMLHKRGFYSAADLEVEK